MEVQEYKKKYTTEESSARALIKTLKILVEFVFAVLLIALTIAMTVKLPLDNIEVMACSMMTAGVAIILLMHSGSRLVHIILKKLKLPNKCR